MQLAHQRQVEILSVSGQAGTMTDQTCVKAQRASTDVKRVTKESKKTRWPLRRKK